MLMPGIERCDWRTNTSAPRTDSPKRAYSSPFANRESCTSPTRMPRWSATSWARSWYEDPAKIIMRFLVTSSMGPAPPVASADRPTGPMGPVAPRADPTRAGPWPDPPW